MSVLHLNFFLTFFLSRYLITEAYKPVIRQLTSEENRNFEARANQNPNNHRTWLDLDGKYLLSWEYDNESITFNATVEATGWIGLGFSLSGGMPGADIVMVWFNKNGLPRIMDAHAKRTGYPDKDDHQDYTLLTASRNETHITASFKRLRDTCDDEQDFRLTSDNTRIIYAFSNDSLSPREWDEAHLLQHAPKNRGTKGVFLFEPPEVRVRLPNDTVIMDFLADNIEVPYDHHLTYWCQMFELPKLPVHHLIRLEPVVHKDHEPYIHHLAIYQCSKNMSQYLGKGEKCFDGDGFNFSAMYECTSKILWFWNYGMKPTDMPDDVGLPMFESQKEAFILLEVHYENLELHKGIMDRSGIRMYLTPTPRPIEAGIILVATVEQARSQIIPPGVSEFSFYAHAENCLAYLPETGVNLFYVLLHAHVHGRKMRVHHYRKGVQLPDFATDDNYDFYYQNFRQLDPPRHVLPGDELVLQCVYDTSKTNQTVYGGFSTLDEMCGSTYFYYPRAARGFICFSYPDPQVFVPIFGSRLLSDNDTVVLPSDKNVTLYDFAKHHLDWEQPGVRQKYKDLVDNGQYVQRLFMHPLETARNVNNRVGGLFGDDDNTQIRTTTHKGYPKVTVPWNSRTEEDSCRKQLEQQENRTRTTSQSKTTKLFTISATTSSSHASRLSISKNMYMILVVLQSIFGLLLLYKVE